MKTYNIYLSDYPTDPIKGQFTNKAAARKAARLYIKKWALDAEIVSIEEA